MDQNILLSGRDSPLLAFPFVIFLFIAMFKLDQLIATPRGFMNRRRPPCGVDESGEPILRDPDGRLSGARRRRKPRN